MLRCKKYKIEDSGKKLRSHSVKQIVANKYVEIRVDTTIKTDLKIKYNKPDLLLLIKRVKK